jgi:hypothetical protein
MAIDGRGRQTDRPELQVLTWRRRRLLDAGFGPDLAEALAADRRMDLHELLQLVERGCPPVLAARILAPLDGQGARR